MNTLKPPCRTAPCGPFARALRSLPLAALVGCVSYEEPVDTRAASLTLACPEVVVKDARGEPRNAAGQIRYCWPTEPFCYCDRDGDCYAQVGYVPCAPRLAVVDAGAPVDASPISDAGVPPDVSRVDVPAPTDAPAPPDVIADAGPAPTADPVAYTGSFPVGTGRATVTLRVMGAARRVLVYRPRVRAPNGPLLVLFHGTNGDGSVMFTDSGAQAVADANGLVVAAPTSRWLDHGDWDHATAETYWETYPNTDANLNQDMVLTRAVPVEAQRAYGTDPRRVFLMGHSNGRFFTQMAATLLRDRVAGFATSSGGLVRCATTSGCRFQGSANTCALLSVRSGWCACAGAFKAIALPLAGYMPPAYLTHGTNDPLVSVQYTCALEAGMRALAAPVTVALRVGDGHVMPSTFARDAWAALGAYRH